MRVTALLVEAIFCFKRGGTAYVDNIRPYDFRKGVFLF